MFYILTLRSHQSAISQPSVIKSICDPLSSNAINTAALNWGRSHEDIAIKAYLDLETADHIDLKLKMLV